MSYLNKKVSYEEISGEIGFSLTNDRYFKYLMQENKSALKYLVRAVLGLKKEEVKDVRILNPVKPGSGAGDKEMTLDLQVILNDESLIDLEMQATNEYNWPERCLNYIYRMDDTLQQGNDYSNMMPIIQVGFLDYTLFKENPEFLSTYKIMNPKNGQVFTDKLQINVVDLNQIEKATESEIESGLARWARLFKAGTWEDLKTIAKEDAEMETTVKQTYDFINMDKFDKAMRDIAESDRIHRENIRKKQLAEIEQQKAEIAQQQTEIEQQQSEIARLSAEKGNMADEIARLRAMLAEHGITE